jgi:hypothetical protein
MGVCTRRQRCTPIVARLLDVGTGENFDSQNDAAESGAAGKLMNEISYCDDSDHNDDLHRAARGR